LPLLILTACAANRDTRRVAGLLFDYATGKNQKIPRDTAAAVPYATMGLELGFNPQVLLVLGQATPDELDWYAGDQLFVATSRGRVVRTAGLPNDLGGRHPSVPGQPDTMDVSYTLDFPDLNIFGAGAVCTRTDRGDDTVDIFGSSIPTRHIVEHCSVPLLKWTFNNEYWEDRTTGYVWRSRQYVHPKSPPIVLQVFRPEDTTPG